MGTRCVTNVVDEKGEVYVSLYRQFDGFPDSHGQKLAEWLEGAVIGNGITSGESRPKFFNGVGDLALRLVTYFRGDDTQIGNFYIVPVGTYWGQEFTYIVKGTSPKSGEEDVVKLKVEGYSGTLYQGSPEDFNEWIKRNEEDF